jgi:hypothetical protein
MTKQRQQSDAVVFQHRFATFLGGFLICDALSNYYDQEFTDPGLYLLPARLHERTANREL